jgi:hypothetical protein
MTSDILEFVSLALFDHGPLTLNEIAAITQTPLPSLRGHLLAHLGERYGCATSTVLGFPVRVWFLLNVPNPSITDTHPND